MCLKQINFYHQSDHHDCHVYLIHYFEQLIRMNNISDNNNKNTHGIETFKLGSLKLAKGKPV
jgi:hypothetical protein